MVPGTSDGGGSPGISNDRGGRADTANSGNGSGDADARGANLGGDDSTHTLSSVDSTSCVGDRDEESNFSASASPELRKFWDRCPALSSDLPCQRNANRILEDSGEGDSSSCENDCGNVRVRAPADASRTGGKMTGPDENPSPQPLPQPGHVEHPGEQDARLPEYRDPFPVLSPMPSSSNSTSSLCGNEDSRLSSGGLCRDATAKICEGEEFHVLLNDTKTEGSNSARRRPSSLQTPIRQAPTMLGSNYEKTSWLDPFPTPDMSRCSTPRTPTSQSRVVTHDSIDKTEWNRLLLALSKFPMEDPVGGEPSSKIGQSTSGGTKGNASSCSQLTRCASAQLSLRKVVSENSMGHKSASFDKIWNALEKYGPDGNELENDTAIDWRFRGSRRGKLPPRELKRHDGIDENGHNDSWDDGAIFPRSSSAPNGLRKRTIPTMAKASREDLPSEINPKQSRQLAAPLTPNRLAFDSRMKVNRDASSRTVALSPGLFSPVRQSGAILSQHAKTLYRKTSERLKERKERRRQRRLAREKKPRRSWWIVIPADHPYKIAWDALTMLWALLGAYRTHTRIRDRVFDQSPLILLTEIWFTLDIFLNFVTEHKTRKGELIGDGKAVWARYLTTWFLIDVLSLIPWERIYVRPVVEKIKRRNIFQSK